MLQHDGNFISNIPNMFFCRVLLINVTWWLEKALKSPKIKKYSEGTLFKILFNNKPGNTRWNSYYECPPEATSSGSTELPSSQIIMNDLFWSQISQLTTLLNLIVKHLINYSQTMLGYLMLLYLLDILGRNTNRLLAEEIVITEQNEIERVLDDLQETSDYITTEQDWMEQLNEWNELLMQEEQAQINVTKESSSYGESANNDLLNSYIHPAINSNVKFDKPYSSRDSINSFESSNSSYASIAISHGATDYGLLLVNSDSNKLEDDGIYSTVLEYTYGIQFTSDWKEDVDPPNRKTIDGKISKFLPLVKRGTEVNSDQAITFNFKSESGQNMQNLKFTTRMKILQHTLMN
ncbi:hypothetical protein RclHR1_03350006 [Rhizophagus clarus]|uniref:Uncharacterized protein n=1 Tax=Rhizophagus clarus TaxID=94130 RepID=A0A2Z6R9B2_9GLOM|nr:hypothetical protein RclHR1_03350006 [Rhizophagus clarus]